jgi:hypothetical protein
MWSLFLDLLACSRNNNGLHMKEILVENSVLGKPHYWDTKEYFNVVTHRPIVRQRPGKHIPAQAYARNKKTSIARQRISKQAFSAIEAAFLRGPCKVVIQKCSAA